MNKYSILAIAIAAATAGCISNTIPDSATPSSIVYSCVCHEPAQVRFVLDGKCVAILYDNSVFDCPAEEGRHEVSIEANGKCILKSSIDVIKGVHHPVQARTSSGA